MKQDELPMLAASHALTARLEAGRANPSFDAIAGRLPAAGSLAMM